MVFQQLGTVHHFCWQKMLLYKSICFCWGGRSVVDGQLNASFLTAGHWGRVGPGSQRHHQEASGQQHCLHRSRYATLLFGSFFHAFLIFLRDNITTKNGKHLKLLVLAPATHWQKATLLEVVARWRSEVVCWWPPMWQRPCQPWFLFIFLAVIPGWVEPKVEATAVAETHQIQRRKCPVAADNGFGLGLLHHRAGACGGRRLSGLGYLGLGNKNQRFLFHPVSIFLV